MKSIFHMYKVTDRKEFEKLVLAMTEQQDAKLFHCYVTGDIFRIATATKVQQFDFSGTEDERKVMEYIDFAVRTLRSDDSRIVIA